MKTIELEVPEKCIVIRYVNADGTDEMAGESGSEYCLMFVKHALHIRLLEIFGGHLPGEQLADSMSFNDMLESLLDQLGDVREIKKAALAAKAAWDKRHLTDDLHDRLDELHDVVESQQFSHSVI